MKRRFSSSPLSSFTLIEMLVAMLVLTILILVVVKIVDFSLQLADATGRTADSGIESKQVLDRIGSDVSGMVIRPDVDQFYFKAAGNDKMFFYSQQTGFFNTNATAYYATNQSPVSLVGYRITSNTADSPSGTPVLERLARGLTEGPDESGPGYSGPYTLPCNTSLSHGDFADELSRRRRRRDHERLGANEASYWNVQGPAPMEMSGRRPEITMMALRLSITSSETTFSGLKYAFNCRTARLRLTILLTPGYTNCAPVYPASITSTTAIVVAIAVLDANSRKIVPAASWSKLIAALQDPTAAQLASNPPVLMASLWKSELPSIAATAGIPPLAASHIKIYQRCYYLNAPRNQ